jgi:hypothetical protein
MSGCAHHGSARTPQCEIREDIFAGSLDDNRERLARGEKSIAQSAQRTGRNRELAEYLKKIIVLAPESDYARTAKLWQENPQGATNTRLTCLTCHAAGRLAARQVTLADQ